MEVLQQSTHYAPKLKSVKEKPVKLTGHSAHIPTPGWACWSDEDYVGKLCRVARRLNAGNLIVDRVVARVLMKYQRYFYDKYSAKG